MIEPETDVRRHGSGQHKADGGERRHRSIHRDA
jgi:hypothetical protein